MKRLIIACLLVEFLRVGYLRAQDEPVGGQSAPSIAPADAVAPPTFDDEPPAQPPAKPRTSDTRIVPSVSAPKPTASSGASPTRSELPVYRASQVPDAERPPAAQPSQTLAKSAGKCPATPSADEQWGQDRTIDGHRFPAANFVPFALSASYIGVRAGFEYHSVPGYAQLPSIGASQPGQLVDLQTVNVAENIDFSLRLHDYVAIFGNAYGKGRIGANADTLLGTETGADYTYGGEVGALLKIFRLGPLQLSVRGHAGYYAGQRAGILALFNDLNDIATGAVTQILNSPTIDLNTAVNQVNVAFAAATADLLTPFHGVPFGGSANIALALTQFIGLQGSVGYKVDNETSEPRDFDGTTATIVISKVKKSTKYITFAAAIDLDAGPIGLPIDVLFEYLVSPATVDRTSPTSSSSESTVEHRIALGVYYSGRTDLQLGVAGYTLLGQPPVLGAQNAALSDKPIDFGSQLVFRYLW
jgi:hypothetical protein